MSDKNSLGFTKQDYIGSKSTLCVGCGHDSITGAIVTALYQSSINPYTMAKMSGIGCSSKTPAYFMNRSHGFNALHGRMAPVATGAKIANSRLRMVGVSGDGDSASIGLGSLAHMIRRNLPIVYIVENNGVYGLTKGQFSATADEGSLAKSGDKNPFESIDLCALAIDLGCSFVARSFSGDARQLVPLLSAAVRHDGTAFIDVISPCVTFANHDGFSKSFHSVREHNWPLQELGFVQPQSEIKVEYEEGTTSQIRLHDGSVLTLKKLNSKEHNLADSAGTLKLLHEARHHGHILTGLLHYREGQKNLVDKMALVEKPLALLDESTTRPSREALTQFVSAFR